MYQSDAEMLFPVRVIPTLKHLRGKAWRELVEQVAKEPDGSEASLAFGLMMIRLNGCVSCHADSYRAMRGCTVCAQQTIERCKQTDEALLRLYKRAQRDVQSYLTRGGQVQDS
jgi:hypothetical protein